MVGMAVQQKYERTMKRDCSAARRTLDAWAAARRHTSAGGTGLPTLDEIFAQDESERVYLMSEVSGLKDSERMRDADRRKYRRSPSLVRMPIETLDCVVVVERSLNSLQAESWLRAFIVAAYPDRGAFAPDDQDLAARQFIEDWAGPCAADSRTERHLRRGFYSMVNNVLRHIQDRLETLPNLEDRLC